MSTVALALIVVFDETRGSIILSQKKHLHGPSMHHDAREKTGLQGQIEIVVEPKDPDQLQRGKVM